MDLIRAARKGNEEAFLQLFDEQHLPLFRFAYSLTGSVAEAEDIVQECFLALLRSDCRHDSRRAPLKAYLFGTVRNQALKRLRRRDEPAGNVMGRADYRSPETEALRGEVEENVARAVMQLPVTQRDVLILAHYEQLPLAEIALALGIELPAVKSRLQRARAALKEALAAYAPGKEGKQ